MLHDAQGKTHGLLLLLLELDVPESFKEYLVEESTEVSTALETVLVVAYQAAFQKTKKAKVASFAAVMKAHAKDFRTTKKYWDKGSKEEQIKNLLSFKIERPSSAILLKIL